MSDIIINKSNWKEYNFSDIFTISRGNRLVKLDQVNGDIAYISSTKKNNGVDNYILPPDYMKVYKNAMTLNNSGSIGFCFYHTYKFVASDHCTVIKIKDRNIELDNYIALFLKPIIESMKGKYNFGREINNRRLKNEKIILPSFENGAPNWEYMKDCTKNIAKPINFNKFIRRESLRVVINKDDWKEFKLSDIFKITRGERLIELDRIPGNVLYFSASEFNNGYTDAISNPLFVESNAIIYTTFGDAYYVNGDFTASDEISIFKNPKLNVYNSLFLTTIISKNKYKYSFGRKAFRNKFINDIISIPVTSQGAPDWQFMEDYIKSLPYSSNLES